MNSKANERSAEGKVDGDVEFQQSLQDWQQRKMAGAVQAGLTSAYESLRSPRNPPPVWKRADCTLVENNRRSVVGNMNIRAKTPDCRFLGHVHHNAAMHGSDGTFFHKVMPVCHRTDRYSTGSHPLKRLGWSTAILVPPLIYSRNEQITVHDACHRSVD
jgi:hypothetical protein